MITAKCPVSLDIRDGNNVEVVVLRKTKVYNGDKCPDCTNGTLNINGHRFQCPTCDGHGKLPGEFFRCHCGTVVGLSAGYKGITMTICYTAHWSELEGDEYASTTHYLYVYNGEIETMRDSSTEQEWAVLARYAPDGSDRFETLVKTDTVFYEYPEREEANCEVVQIPELERFIPFIPELGKTGQTEAPLFFRLEEYWEEETLPCPVCCGAKEISLHSGKIPCLYCKGKDGNPTGKDYEKKGKPHCSYAREKYRVTGVSLSSMAEISRVHLATMIDRHGMEVNSISVEAPNLQIVTKDEEIPSYAVSSAFYLFEEKATIEDFRRKLKGERDQYDKTVSWEKLKGLCIPELRDFILAARDAGVKCAVVPPTGNINSTNSYTLWAVKAGQVFNEISPMQAQEVLADRKHISYRVSEILLSIYEKKKEV